MIITLTLPEQQPEYEIWVNTNVPKHIWHDVPKNTVYVYTEQDYLDYMGIEE